MVFNGAQFHLLTNHLPVIGSLFSLLVLLSGFAFKNKSVRRTGMALLVFTALTTAPAYLTGEPAEEVVEDQPGVTKSLIHEHEEAAEASLVLMALAGAVGAAGLFMGRTGRESGEGKAQVAALGVTLLAAAALGRTAHLGGLIRHSELRVDGAGVAASTEGDAPGEESGEKGEHSDDDGDAD